jgi:hypothetical protein
MTDFAELLRALSSRGVRFVIVGGTAATAHGSAGLTFDLDVVYDRAPDNLSRLFSALAPHHPYLRGAPPGLPFVWDEQTLARGLNFTLTTVLGDNRPVRRGRRWRHLRSARPPCRRDGPLRNRLPDGGHREAALKRAAGRPKDLETIAEFEEILELLARKR